MSFDYNKFIKKVHSSFDDLSVDEVDKILSLPEGYRRDGPASTGKSLRISRIKFSGDKGDDESFEYDRGLDDGVNMWVADNLKGKSTVFKLIKYALTGRDSLKQDVKRWIDNLYLEFEIGDNTFTVLLELSKPRLHGILYSTDIESIISNNFSQTNVFFDAKNGSSYETQIQSFFFNQFSFYSLKWTQKDSAKDSTKLHEASSSWATYYKSIYLESKDVEKLFYGAQNELMFQMLLGLDLTYPINRLKLKKDMKQHELSILRIKGSSSEVEKEEEGGAEIDLEDELTEIDKKILKAREDLSLVGGSSALWEEHSEVSAAISEKDVYLSSLRSELKARNRELDNAYLDIGGVGNERDNLSVEIQKNTRKILDLEEYLELGVFFSNLDIKSCPHCNHTVTEESRKSEKETHQCSLCNSDISSGGVDGDYYKQKIEQLQSENEKFSTHIGMLDEKIISDNSEAEDIQKMIDDVSSKVTKAESDVKLINQLKDIEAKLKEADKDRGVLEDQLSRLLIEKGGIKYRFESESKEDVGSDDSVKIEKCGTEIKILQAGISELEHQRFKNSEQILQDLQSLILEELHSIGLESFSEVRITDKFRLIFNQHGGELEFSDITEGEQLRVKLAFYLGLIQMDVKYNVGRHPKLLIIDTPGKEEGDKHYLQGLSDMLSSIDEKYGKEVQILVGTASRDLIVPDLSDKTEVIEPETYLF